MTKETISIAEAEALIGRTLVASGLLEASAISTAKALVAAEAEGQVGHGFSRLADYVAQIRTGKVNGKAVPRCEAAGTSAVVVDADHGLAFPALDTAIDWGIEVASRTGCASMSVKRSHHCGALSIQVEKIAAAGLCGMMVANSPVAIAPWGSSVPVFGTNPIAFAAPRQGRPPLVIDLSLSKVARGKVMHARKSGQTIPQGWALDRDGQPTTDPEAALNGSMVPIGEAKGTALALMVEILAATFTSANASTEVSSFFHPEGSPPGSGQFLLALKPADPEGFARRLEALLGLIEGLEGARLPGSRRLSAMAHAREHGLSVNTSYLAAAREIAAGR